MKTEEKLKFVDGLVRSTARQTDLEGARKFADTAKGVLMAWNIDLSISADDFSRLYKEIDLILKTKHEMEMNYA